MYCYIVCRFLKNDQLGPRPYTYEVRKELFDKVKIGYHYKIKNSDGYSYQGSLVEVTGLFRTEEECVVKDDKLIPKLEASSFCYKLKEIVEMEEVGKYANADEIQYFIVSNWERDCRYPIAGDSRKYESARSAYEDMEWMIHPRFNELATQKNYEPDNFSIKYKDKTIIEIDSNGIKINGNILFTGDSKTIYENKKEKKAMNKIFGNVEFGKYTGNEIKMSVNGLAYLTENGKYVAYDKNKLTLTDVTDFVFDMEGLLYLFPVAIKDIQVGDIIKHGNSYVIVRDISGGNFLEVIEPCSNEVKTIMPLRNIFGFDFYTKVVSLIGENTFGDFNEDNPFGNMLPFFLMKDSGETSALEMFMLMNLTNGARTNNSLNPFLLMALSKNEDMKDILPLMMMTGNSFGFGATKENCDCDCKNSCV